MKELAKALNHQIKQTNEAQQYFAIKEAISKDEYILSLLEVIQQTQRQAQKCLQENDIENYKVKQKSLKLLKEEFMQHPLIHNYLICKQELYDVLEQIVHILSEN